MEGILGGELCSMREAPVRLYDENVLVGHESPLRMMGDTCHLAGVVSLLISLIIHQDASGISIFSQELFAVALTTRYLNPIHGMVSMYRVGFASGFILFTLASLFLLRLNANIKATYTAEHDTCPHLVIGIGCALLAWLTHLDAPFLEVTWWFSVYLEGCALAPQSWIMSKWFVGVEGFPLGVTFSFYLLGGYPVFYFLNWIAHYQDHAYCQGWMAIVPGAVHLIFFGWGLFNLHFPRDIFVRNALARLKTIRMGSTGLGDEGLGQRQNRPLMCAPVLQCVSGIMRCFEFLLGLFWQVMPNLEVPDETEGPSGPKRYPFYTRSKKQEDEGLMNLLPIRLSSR